LPLEKIAHDLMNEPWCYSWDEVQNIPLNALVLIWTKPPEKREITNAEAMAVVQRAQERKRRGRAGIWYQADAIWSKGDGGT
jgi:hypothetical protein